MTFLSFSKKYIKLPGFTLIETSISLIIFGLIVAVSLPFFTSMIELDRQRRTNVHREQIFYALATYYAMNNFRLPCPSLPSRNGRSFENCPKNTPRCIGIIPYQELGIPADIAKDGHGNWFTYCPDPDSTKYTSPRNHFHSIEFHHDKTKWKNIKLYEAPTRQEMYDPRPIFVLISHEKEGRGAYRHDDTRSETSHPYEDANIQADHQFYVGKAPDYTHQVSYMPYAVFLGYYGQLPNKSMGPSSTSNLNPQGDVFIAKPFFSSPANDIPGSSASRGRSTPSQNPMNNQAPSARTRNGPSTPDNLSTHQITE